VLAYIEAKRMQGVKISPHDA